MSTAVAVHGRCRTEEVQTGCYWSTSSGPGTIWIRWPAAAARKLAITGILVVGWVQATVAPLQAQPLQCYRCLEMGHTRQRCTCEADRSGCCYNYGDPTHRANASVSPPKCPVCSDMGRPAGHRLGSRACTSGTPKKGPERAGKKTERRKSMALMTAPALKGCYSPLNS
ncbi:uncharacterized protein LOC143174604 [Nomia melanderi]|uniref:uncharacterized protein LOC143174604 n=1 Tax=Nomia melanderi TaxID=2448451 RepID=UPI003FCEB5ED